MGAGHRHGPHDGALAFRGRLLVVLALTAAVLVAQVVGGLLSGSLALLADAGHMLTDVAGLTVSLLAMQIAARPATPEKTFGYLRAEVLAASANAALLLGVAVWVVVEAVRRLREPPEVASGVMLAVALVGLAVNAVGLLLLHSGQQQGLHLRGAYLEVLGDLVGSAAVIAAALVIGATGFTLADPIASLVIVALIVPRALALLREAVDVLLEATPKGMDLGEVRRHMVELPHVRDVHDLHVWSLGTSAPVLSAHVVVDNSCFLDGHAPQLIDELQACLAGHFDVEHSTFQLEPASHADHEHATHH
ncbi:MAG: cation diffusion facilitator family transporter [Actinomycetota bacterium]|nr:cation diffusion facilitator family transporter [Actinomycetota bacterium]